MTGKARLVEVKDTPAMQSVNEKPRTIKLISGRELEISSRADADLIEIFEPGGELVIKFLLTENGPVMKVEGCKLDLKGAESIALRAPTIEISAEEKARVESKGTLEIDSVKEMGIHSDEDIRVVGKIIHLN